MKLMKLLFLIIMLACVITGCAAKSFILDNDAKPVIIDNGVQRRTFTPCTDDRLCFRDSYEVAWDRLCNWNNQGTCCSHSDFPISHRNKQTEYESNKVEPIYTPRN